MVNTPKGNLQLCSFFCPSKFLLFYLFLSVHMKSTDTCLFIWVLWSFFCLSLVCSENKPKEPVFSMFWLHQNQGLLQVVLGYCIWTFMMCIWIVTQNSHFSYLSESIFCGFFLTICFAVNPGVSGLACFWDKFPVGWCFSLVVPCCEGRCMKKTDNLLRQANHWHVSWNLL